jgi:hypothetical protein
MCTSMSISNTPAPFCSMKSNLHFLNDFISIYRFDDMLIREVGYSKRSIASNEQPTASERWMASRWDGYGQGQRQRIEDAHAKPRTPEQSVGESTA